MALDPVVKVRELLDLLNGSNDGAYLSILKRLFKVLDEQHPSLPEGLRRRVVYSLQVVIIQCKEGYASSTQAVLCLGTLPLWSEPVRAWLRDRYSYENTASREKVAEAIARVLKANAIL
ncbi:MAG: hypothetical protein UU25_C0015G0002 [Microgenomates group bacterium GW2011_GWB1_40_9]|nr:MAG: hypothetical protein UU25_C0015G0002 [Microgenomates group bacterium GW2011_GWB1_40_9]